MTDQLEGLKKLREPFPASQIGKLPKGGIQLDFVGHGYITQRLLDVDPLWNWKPVAFDQLGLPQLDEFGGLWIRLTVCGMTRLGYGDAGGRRGPNAVKEAIGDALRNAGMRFGLALDLWCKGDPDAHQQQQAEPALSEPQLARRELWSLCKESGRSAKLEEERFLKDIGTRITEADADTIRAYTAGLADEIAAAKTDSEDG